MPLQTLDFQGKGVFLTDSSSSSSSSSFLHFQRTNKVKGSSVFGFGFGFGPTSILDSIGSPSPPTSTSTYFGGGGGSTDSSGVAAVVSGNIGSSDLEQIPVGTITTTTVASEEKCGLGMEDWESVLSESAGASPSQEQSILRWIMGGDLEEDPSLGLNKILQTGTAGPPDYDFSPGFGVVDQGFPSSDSTAPAASSAAATGSNSGGGNYKFPTSQNPIFSPLPTGNLMPIPPAYTTDFKPQVYNPNPNLIINQNQSHQFLQNPSFFLPLPFNQQPQNLIIPPQAKRHNPGSGFDSILPHYQQQQQRQGGIMRNMNMKPKGELENLGNQNQQNPPPQAVIDQLINAAELIQTGNSLLAQGILARLNHQLSPIGKPFNRAAFYLKESLFSLLHGNNNINSVNHPLSLIFKISAYKSLSEISPFLQFANFTSNQAILESLEGCERIHIIDFDIGYGGQWSSLMQELSLRNGGSPSLRITAFSTPNSHDHHLELELTRENLIHFANEINMPFEFDLRTLESLNSFHVSEHESIAVNLPTGSFFNHHVLRFVKQLSPKIVVSVDRGCERTDLPFPHHLIHALQSNSNLLESIDAVNVNQDALQKIERYLIQPSIEKIVWSRFQLQDKTPHWRTLLLSSGYSPLTFSNFSESQAECVLKRTPVRGFHVEKRQSSLVLCWQRKEIVSVSAWR